MRATTTRGAALAGALLAVLAAGTAGRTAGQEPFREQTSVVAVEVPVQVVLDGKPVRGLTAEHFRLFEGRERQELTGFEVFDLALVRAAEGAASPPPELPVAARRHFLLLFDLSFSDPASILKAREAARDLLREGLHPTDLVAVATYSVNRGPSLLVSFTPDRRQVDLAIETLGLGETTQAAVDPMGLVFGTFENAFLANMPLPIAPPPPGSGQAAGAPSRVREYQMEAVENLKDMALQAEKTDIDARRNQVLTMMSSFATLGRLMASVDGRKHVVYFSEGFDASLLFSRRDAGDKEITQAAERGEIWKIDSDQRFGSRAVQAGLEDLIDELRRGDCIIQAVDVGGARAASDVLAGTSDVQSLAASGTGQDGLFLMADGTGGELYRNFNDLSGAMDQLLERTAVTYVLTFQPDVRPDGSFHPVRVELKGAPRGARVVHRPGYYAPRPFFALSALERRVMSASELLEREAGGDLAAAVLASPFAGAGQAADVADVAVVVEIEGESFLAGTVGDVVSAEIYAYALDGSGSVADFFGQSLGLDLTKVRAGLARSGLRFFGQLELPPGEYTLRTLVRNGQTGRSSLSIERLSVPDFAAAGPVVLPPFFAEAPGGPGGWLLARGQRGTRQAAAYPFVAGGETYVPAARPVVAPGRAVRLALVAYDLGEGPPAVTGRVLDAAGREVPGSGLAVERAERGEGGGTRLVARFEPGPLADGEYTLVVELTDPATGRRQTSSARFAVRREAG